MLFDTEAINTMLAELPAREEIAMRLRYGIAEHRHTLAAIGKQFGLTKQSAQRILKKANTSLLEMPNV